MAEIDVWKDYARRLGMPFPEEAEKDYLQEIMLREIYASIGRELVFRGGTAISKLYASGRFSEDLDFIMDRRAGATASKTVDRVEGAIKSIGNYFNVSYEKEQYKDMVEFTVAIYGPLYRASGNNAAKQRIGIDINMHEKCLMRPLALQRMPVYTDIGTYSLITETAEELLADKVKAAIERRAKHRTVFVRDIYDVWFLIAKHGLGIEEKLVSKKMEMYGIMPFSAEDFGECVQEAEKYWVKELSRIMLAPPRYEDASADIFKAIYR